MKQIIMTESQTQMQTQEADGLSLYLLNNKGQVEDRQKFINQVRLPNGTGRQTQGQGRLNGQAIGQAKGQNQEV